MKEEPTVRDPVQIDIAKLSHDARILSMDADGNYTSAEVDYIVTFKNYADNNDAIDGGLEEIALEKVRVLAKAVSIGSIKLSSVTIRERLAPSAFRVTAIYGESDESESGSGTGQGGGGTSESAPEMTYECSAESKHVTLARNQKVVWVAADEGKINLGASLGNRIGWNCKFGDDFSAEGCDTPTGTAVETWTKTMPYSRITTAKKIKWGETVGCINKGAWKGWPPGCAMFMGASFSKDKKQSSVQVSFHFAVGAPNETVTIEGKDVQFQKSPFDYVWPVTDAARGETGDETGAIATPRTRAIVLSRVAREADFNVLGI